MKNQLRHKGKAIGELRGKHLIKTGRQAQLYRIFDGFGISKDVLDLVEKITVHYQGKIYTTTPTMFWENGIPHNFMGDEQLILPRKFWSFKDKNQVELV